MLTKSFDVWTRSLIERLYDAVRRGNDITRTVELTASLTPLNSEKAVYVTLFNTTGGPIDITINSGDSISIPTSFAITIDVVNTGVISVTGSGTLSYIVSK